MYVQTSELHTSTICSQGSARPVDWLEPISGFMQPALSCEGLAQQAESNLKACGHLIRFIQYNAHLNMTALTTAEVVTLLVARVYSGRVSV